MRYIHKNRGFIRGIEFRFEVDGIKFEYGEGDIYLFGTILNAFLSQYVTLNAFAILTIMESGTNKEYTWKPSLGKILPI